MVGHWRNSFEMSGQLHYFLYKSIFYKNIEAEIYEILRIF